MNKKEKMKKLLGLMGPDNSWMQDNENSVKVSQAYQKIDPSIKKLQPKQPTKLQRAIIDLLEAGHNPNEASKIAGCTSTYVHETKRQVEGGAFDAQNHLGGTLNIILTSRTCIRRTSIELNGTEKT